MKLKMKIMGLSIVSFLVLGVVSRAQAGEGHVGEIRYSLLTPEQFQGAYGKEWELMQGQDIPDDSELLPLWGQSKVPDSRGVFLRCSNEGRSSKTGNPEGDLRVGMYQADTFKSHDHGGGDHHHSVSLELTASRNPNGHQCNTVAFCPQLNKPVQSSGSGKIIRTDGEEETRPRCITINAFVKMRESAPNPSAGVPAVTAPLMREITDHSDFRTAVESVVRDMISRRRM